MEHDQEDTDDDHQEYVPSYNDGIESLILDVDISISESLSDLNENDIKSENDTKQRDGNFSNFIQIGGKKIKKESKVSIICDLYFNALQTNGYVNSNEFLEQIGVKYRRKLGQIISVLEFFEVVKKEKNIVKLLSESHLNPPIKLKNLNEEIKFLESEVNNLKEQLAEAKMKQSTAKLFTSEFQ